MWMDSPMPGTLDPGANKQVHLMLPMDTDRYNGRQEFAGSIGLHKGRVSMNRVVLIIGAGASIPFFDPPLSTDVLTKSVCDKNRWADLLSRYEATAESANHIEACAIGDLLQELNRHSDRNFEDFIEITDKIASYMFDPSDSKPLHAFIRMLRGQLKHYPMHTWDAVPFLFRQLISEQVGEFHEKHQSRSYRTLISILADFLRHLVTDNRLSVFSFNYDDVIIDALSTAALPVEDGFSAGYFNASKFLNGESVVGFPHGHARFVYDHDGMRCLESIARANTERLDNLYNHSRMETCYIMDGRTSYSFNTFMVTGRDKDASFNINPFSAYYQRMASDLLSAKAVVVVGYSFQDPHINRLLVNFRELKSDNRVLIVDFLADTLDVLVAFRNTSSLVHRLLHVFGVNSIPLRGDLARYTYRLQAGVDEINTKGYGELYPGIGFCKTGFEAFLGNFRTVLQELCSL